MPVFVFHQISMTQEVPSIQKVNIYLLGFIKNAHPLEHMTGSEHVDIPSDPMSRNVDKSLLWFTQKRPRQVGSKAVLPKLKQNSYRSDLIERQQMNTIGTEANNYYSCSYHNIGNTASSGMESSGFRAVWTVTHWRWMNNPTYRYLRLCAVRCSWATHSCLALPICLCLCISVSPWLVSPLLCDAAPPRTDACFPSCLWLSFCFPFCIIYLFPFSLSSCLFALSVFM